MAQAGKSSSPFAGFWRALPRQDRAYAGLVKQKSHVHVVEQPTTEAEWTAWLNNQADQAAKLGARLHGGSASLAAELEDRLARTKRFLRAAARVLCSGPAPKQEWADLRRPPASRVAAVQIAHEFVVVGRNRWQCVRCLRCKTTPVAALDRKECRLEDRPPSFVRVEAHLDSHDVEWCELSAKPGAPAGEILLFCKKCSMYATSKPAGLGGPCPAENRPGWKISEAALHKRRRFLKGQHPKCGESATIIASWPMSRKALKTPVPTFV